MFENMNRSQQFMEWMIVYDHQYWIYFCALESDVVAISIFHMHSSHQ